MLEKFKEIKNWIKVERLKKDEGKSGWRGKHTYRSMIHLELLDNFSKIGSEFFDPSFAFILLQKFKEIPEAEEDIYSRNARGYIWSLLIVI